MKQISTYLNGENLNHLRFADDIAHIADYAKELLNKLYRLSLEVGLKINISKTKIIAILILIENINTAGIAIEQTTS